MPLRLAILTISDAGSRGERADASGDLIASWARERHYTLAVRALVPDETSRVAALLAEWADANRADVILTTGGTGLTARDRNWAELVRRLPKAGQLPNNPRVIDRILAVAR